MPSLVGDISLQVHPVVRTKKGPIDHGVRVRSGLSKCGFCGGRCDWMIAQRSSLISRSAIPSGFYSRPEISCSRHQTVMRYPPYLHSTSCLSILESSYHEEGVRGVTPCQLRIQGQLREKQLDMERQFSAKGGLN